MSRKLRFLKEQINKAALLLPARPVLQSNIDLEELEVMIFINKFQVNNRSHFSIKTIYHYIL